MYWVWLWFAEFFQWISSLTPDQMLNRLVKIGCDISKDYVLRKTRNMSGRATSKIPRERRSKNQRMLPIADAKRLKLGNEATNIAVTDSLMDLRVTMSNDASFRRQIKNVVDSANKMCGWILRTFTTKKKPQPHAHTLEVYDTLQTDYCSQLWCPVQTGDIQALEMVQRSFVRKISGFQHLNYWDKLQRLKLYSLERRWERYMIIYTWRILEKTSVKYLSPWTRRNTIQT